MKKTKQRILTLLIAFTLVSQVSAFAADEAIDALPADDTVITETVQIDEESKEPEQVAEIKEAVLEKENMKAAKVGAGEITDTQSFATALEEAADGTTVTLTCDVEIDDLSFFDKAGTLVGEGNIIKKKKITIDFAGYTVKVAHEDEFDGLFISKSVKFMNGVLDFTECNANIENLIFVSERPDKPLDFECKNIKLVTKGTLPVYYVTGKKIDVTVDGYDFVINDGTNMAFLKEAFSSDNGAVVIPAWTYLDVAGILASAELDGKDVILLTDGQFASNGNLTIGAKIKSLTAAVYENGEITRSQVNVDGIEFDNAAEFSVTLKGFNFTAMSKSEFAALNLGKTVAMTLGKEADNCFFTDTKLVTFDANGGVLTGADKWYITKGETFKWAKLSGPSVKKDGYTFKGWTISDGRNFDVDIAVSDDMTVTAAWSKNETVSGNGGKGTSKIAGTSTSTSVGSVEDLEDVVVPLAPVTNNTRIKYISGYGDGSFKPASTITRAEAAAIFFRVLTDENKNVVIANTFNDVDANAWYAQSVNYLASKGIINGYSDGTFRPDAGITRAEFAAMAAKFGNVADGTENIFNDVSANSWAAKYIMGVSAKGWISGYPEGDFRPDNQITRAEAVKVINKILNRGSGISGIYKNMQQYTDLDDAYWAYADIMEASSGK